MAVFDLLGTALIAEALYLLSPSTPLGFHPRIHVYPATLVLGQLSHLALGVKTPVTSLLLGEKRW
jgi:hypothetical protein